MRRIDCPGQGRSNWLLLWFPPSNRRRFGSPEAEFLPIGPQVIEQDLPDRYGYR